MNPDSTRPLRPPEQVTDHAVRLASSITRIAALPAVASHNWCHLAAKALTADEPGLWCAVAIVTAPDDTAGPACHSFGTNPAESTPRPLEHASLESLIEQMDLSSLSAPEEGVVVSLSRLVESWNEPGTSAALRPLTIGVPGACILVLTHAHERGAPDKARLASTLAALGARADTAFESRTGTIQWLTEREFLILELLIRGSSVRAIADELGRSPHTVHDHVKSLHRKLDASSRGALIARALGHASHDAPPTLRTPVLSLGDNAITELKPHDEPRAGQEIELPTRERSLDPRSE